MFKNEEIWKLKSHYELENIDKECETWIEHYLGELISVQHHGTRVRYIRFNCDTGLIFPAVEDSLVLISESNKPIAKVDANSNLGQLIFEGDKGQDFGVDLELIYKAIIMDHSCFKIHKKSLLRGYDNPKRCYRDIYNQYIDEIYGEVLSELGSPPIYGYIYHYSQLTEPGFKKRFKIIDIVELQEIENYLDAYDQNNQFRLRRDSRSLECILEDLNLAYCINMTFQDKCSHIIDKLEELGHILPEEYPL